VKKKTQPKNTKKRTKAGENGFSYKLEALGILYAALGLFMAVSLWYPEVGFLGDYAHYFRPWAWERARCSFLFIWLF
jgi:S-DNA-T family DNA segregation ATPase FtsK/SpoIIIE